MGYKKRTTEFNLKLVVLNLIHLELLKLPKGIRWNKKNIQFTSVTKTDPCGTPEIAP